MIDWPEIKGLLALPPRDRPNVIALYADVVAEIVAEFDALKAENQRLTNALLLSVERHIAHATGHDNDVIDYARRVIAGEDPQP